MSAGNLAHVSARAQLVSRATWPTAYDSTPRLHEASEALFALSLYAVGDDAVWFRWLSDALLHVAVEQGRAQERRAA